MTAVCVEKERERGRGGGGFGAMAHRRAVMTLYRRSLIHARSWAINTVRVMMSSHHISSHPHTHNLTLPDESVWFDSVGLVMVSTVCRRWTRRPCPVPSPCQIISLLAMHASLWIPCWPALPSLVDISSYTLRNVVRHLCQNGVNLFIGVWL